MPITGVDLKLICAVLSNFVGVIKYEINIILVTFLIFPVLIPGKTYTKISLGQTDLMIGRKNGSVAAILQSDTTFLWSLPSCPVCPLLPTKI